MTAHFSYYMALPRNLLVKFKEPLNESWRPWTNGRNGFSTLSLALVFGDAAAAAVYVQ